MAYRKVKFSELSEDDMVPDIEVEHAKIALKNFSGNRFNPGGERSFRFVIEDPEMADQLAQDGWNVKIKASDEGEPYMYLPVALGYKVEGRKSKVYMDENGRRTELKEDSVHLLDDVFIENANLLIHPGYSIDDITGKVHIKAWLGIMYAFVSSRDRDPWADNYVDEERPF